MHGKGTDVVAMSLQRRYLLVGVVVEDTHLKVVSAANEPVLANDPL